LCTVSATKSILSNFFLKTQKTAKGKPISKLHQTIEIATDKNKMQIELLLYDYMRCPNTGHVCILFSETQILPELKNKLMQIETHNTRPNISN
jgi:hypothetical protein